MIAKAVWQTYEYTKDESNRSGYIRQPELRLVMYIDDDYFSHRTVATFNDIEAMKIFLKEWKTDTGEKVESAGGP